MKRIILAIILSLGFVSQACAQATDPEWLGALNRQLAQEKQCEVGFYILVKESPLGSKLVQEARVQCVDGRQFDASRISPKLPFKITECGTAAC